MIHPKMFEDMQRVASNIPQGFAPTGENDYAAAVFHSEAQIFLPMAVNEIAILQKQLDKAVALLRDVKRHLPPLYRNFSGWPVWSDLNDFLESIDQPAEGE